MQSMYIHVHLDRPIYPSRVANCRASAPRVDWSMSQGCAECISALDKNVSALSFSFILSMICHMLSSCSKTKHGSVERILDTLDSSKWSSILVNDSFYYCASEVLRQDKPEIVGQHDLEFPRRSCKAELEKDEYTR
jgi:hypothetical protein